MSENQVVASGVKAKRPRIGIEKFMEAWESSNSAAEAAEKLGTTAGAASARASKERTTGGLPLKEMPKGGGPKSDPTAKLAFLAKLTGKTVEELQAKGDAQKAAAATRAAERAAAKSQG